MVLCDEILSGDGGGVEVNGLGELVTNEQVKKGYVRAIAKVHPDKVKLRIFFLLFTLWSIVVGSDRINRSAWKP